ncbi:MAG: hypothetical protein IPL32_18755 [Chloracidobacterium sp.]|nr:hypothetical protein [Chloracidobacterium sp.]
MSTADDRNNMRMDMLEGLADAWSAEVNLGDMIRNATSPMRLNRGAPADVVQGFHERMMAQVDAIARQAFMEGAWRGVCLANDEMKKR